MKFLISTSENSEQNYKEALSALGIEAEGGFHPTLDGSFDGLILCGGGDISPSIYGEEINGSVNIDRERDEIETKLLSMYYGKPILGICRGMQFINASLGGTLFQDIGNGHRGEGKNDLLHKVTSKKGSIMERLYGESFTVNSLHHQAVAKLADGFSATLFAEDGTVEAIEHESQPIFALQWHPERLALSRKRDGAADGMKVFEEFLKIAIDKR